MYEELIVPPVSSVLLCVLLQTYPGYEESNVSIRYEIKSILFQLTFLSNKQFSVI